VGSYAGADSASPVLTQKRAPWRGQTISSPSIGWPLVSTVRQRFARPDTETRAMAGTDDLVALDRLAAGQHRAIVGTNIFNGVELAADVEHGGYAGIEINRLVVARLDGRGFGNENPVSHEEP
jgi:hypothetical protein